MMLAHHVSVNGRNIFRFVTQTKSYVSVLNDNIFYV